MFKEILKIIPKLDNGDLNAMERSLSSRFTRVAKKFGKGLVGAIAGGGIAGLALGVIDKLLNPLKETQDAIDRILTQADDVVTNAEQFGTTAGKLFKLTKIAESTGLDQDSLFTLITKFQTAIAEAKADPTKDTSVRAFADMPDTAEAFFHFIQSLRKMEKNSQLLVQQEIFGEKQILKMSDFLQTDMVKQLAELQARPAEDYTPGLKKTGGLKDLADILKARVDLEDMNVKAATIQDEMITSRANQIQIERNRENMRIANYHTMATVQETTNKILFELEKGGLNLAGLVIKVTDLSSIAKKFSMSRFFRGLFGGEGK